MKLLRTHIEHGNNGDRMVANLWENSDGFRVVINIEIAEIEVAHIETQDNNLQLWEEIVK